MQVLGDVFEWIRENEAVLSGIAAAIVIGGMLVALVSRLRSASARGWSGPSVDDRGDNGAPVATPTIRRVPTLDYCTTPDGLRLAYSSVGEGTPLVRALGWFTHLDLEWQNETSRYFWERLAARHRVLRYDARGMGLSDREVEHLSLETRLLDLETVVDAAGLERFALMGFSEGGTAAIAYAAKHPERVSRLVLWGSYLRAPAPEEFGPVVSLVRQIPEQWASESAAFHQMWAAHFIPDGGAEHNRLCRELQRASSSPENAYRAALSLEGVDVTESARRIQAPTLVMHRKGDLVVGVSNARELAAEIPDARLLVLDGSNHWMWMHEPDTEDVLSAIHDFVDG